MDALLAKAISLALKAHEGQVDKSGMPYAGHIMRYSKKVFLCILSKH